MTKRHIHVDMLILCHVYTSVYTERHKSDLKSSVERHITDNKVVALHSSLHENSRERVPGKTGVEIYQLGSKSCGFSTPAPHVSAIWTKRHIHIVMLLHTKISRHLYTKKETNPI